MEILALNQTIMPYFFLQQWIVNFQNKALKVKICNYIITALYFLNLVNDVKTRVFFILLVNPMKMHVKFQEKQSFTDHRSFPE